MASLKKGIIVLRRMVIPLRRRFRIQNAGVGYKHRLLESSGFEYEFALACSGCPKRFQLW
jgi:hypothetical protein